MIEFTLVGIPVIFLLISIFELSRGVWIYLTVAHAIKEGARYAIVHGNNCGVSNNSCQVTIRNIATRIQQSGVGLLPNQFSNIQFISATRTITCPTLQACLNAGALGDTYWPTASPGSLTPDVGGNSESDLELRGRYLFRTGMMMFWPGAVAVNPFGAFNLGASSKEGIQY